MRDVEPHPPASSGSTGRSLTAHRYGTASRPTQRPAIDRSPISPPPRDHEPTAAPFPPSSSGSTGRPLTAHRSETRHAPRRRAALDRAAPFPPSSSGSTGRSLTAHRSENASRPPSTRGPRPRHPLPAVIVRLDRTIAHRAPVRKRVTPPVDARPSTAPPPSPRHRPARPDDRSPRTGPKTRHAPRRRAALDRAAPFPPSSSGSTGRSLTAHRSENASRPPSTRGPRPRPLPPSSSGSTGRSLTAHRSETRHDPPNARPSTTPPSTRGIANQPTGPLDAWRHPVNYHHDTNSQRPPSMRHKSLKPMQCPIARGLEHVGEWWTILILRDAFRGLRRFDEFRDSLGIAPTMLTKRLNDAGRIRLSGAPPLQRASAARRICSDRTGNRFPAGAAGDDGVRQPSFSAGPADRAHRQPGDRRRRGTASGRPGDRAPGRRPGYAVVTTPIGTTPIGTPPVATTPVEQRHERPHPDRPGAGAVPAAPPPAVPAMSARTSRLLQGADRADHAGDGMAEHPGDAGAGLHRPDRDLVRLADWASTR